MLRNPCAEVTKIQSRIDLWWRWNYKITHGHDSVVRVFMNRLEPTTRAALASRNATGRLLSRVPVRESESILSLLLRSPE